MTLFLFLLFLFVLLSIVYFSWRYGISPMPSTKSAIGAIVDLVPVKKGSKEELKKDPKKDPKIIVDLGSGWGSLVFSLAKKFPNSHIIGYEISFIPYLFSYFLLKLLCYQNVELKRCDFFTKSLAKADVVVVYLYPGAMEKLKGKLSKELQSSSCVISNTFSIFGVKSSKEIELDDLYKTKILLYEGHVIRQSIDN